MRNYGVFSKGISSASGGAEIVNLWEETGAETWKIEVTSVESRKLIGEQERARQRDRSCQQLGKEWSQKGLDFKR